MKQLLLLSLLVILNLGCSHFVTNQKEELLDSTGKVTKLTTTHVSATTMFDSQSTLSKFHAIQSDKTQSATVGALDQSSTSTNVVTALGHIDSILKTVAGSAVK